MIRTLNVQIEVEVADPVVEDGEEVERAAGWVLRVLVDGEIVEGKRTRFDNVVELLKVGEWALWLDSGEV